MSLIFKTVLNLGQDWCSNNPGSLLFISKEVRLSASKTDLESVSFISCSKLFSCADAIVIGSSIWGGQSNERKWQGHRGRKGEACKSREVGGYISLSWSWPLAPYPWCW